MTRAAVEPEPRNALVEEHLHLIQHVVNQVAARYPSHVDRGELWNAGAYGLVDASRRYDPETGIPFPRYAMIRIRGAIIDSTRGRDWSTRNLRRNARRLAAAAEAFVGANGREPTSSELAAAAGLTDHELARLRADLAATSVLRLDQPFNSTESFEAATLADVVEEKERERLPEDELEHRELVGTLLAVVDQLPAPLDTVIRRYYLDGALLREIAADLGVTEARVSQIRSEGLMALRAYFQRGYDGVDEPVADDAPGRRHRAAFLTEVDRHTTWRSRFDAASDYVERAHEPRAHLAS